MTGINCNKEAEEAIRKSEAQYRLLTENMKDVIWILDAETLLFRYISPSIERLRGYKPEEIIGFSVEEAVMPQTRQLVRDLIHQRAADLLSGKVPTEQFYTEELRQPCKDGSSVWTEVITSYYVNPETKRVEVRGATRDISERKKAELEISIKDDLLHLTGEMARVGGWEFDAVTGKGTWTDEVARIHDLDPHEPTNVELGTSFYTGESRAKIEQAIQTAIEQAQPYDLELEMITASGNHKWVRTVGNPILEDGKTVKVRGIFQDITERKEYEEALRNEQYLMNVLMDTLPDAIFFKDLQNRFVRINQAQAENLGVADPHLALGKTDHDFFSPEHAQPADLDEQKIIRTGEPLLNHEEQLTYPDRPSEWVLVTKMPFRDLNGEIIGTFGLSRKITDLKRNQEKLRETHDYLENLINYANAPIIVWDPQYLITRFNHAFEKLTGFSSEDVVGKSLTAILPQEHQSESLALIQQTMSGEHWESVEIPVRHRDGSNRIVLWNSANILAADGITVISTIAQGQDITDRKQVEEALRAREQSFRAIFEQAAVGVAQVESKTGRFIKLNQKHCDIVGYTREELLSKTFQSITYPDDLEEDLNNMQRLFAGEIDQFSMEKRYFRKDGSIVWANLTVSPLWKKGEEPLYNITVIEDITERKLIEEELVHSRQMLQLIFDNIPQRVFWKDRNSVFQGCNRPFADDYNLADPKEVIGKSDYDLVIKENAEFFRADDKQVMESNIAKLNYEEQQLHHDGTSYWLKTNKIPLHDQDGKVIGVLGTYEDITERKKTQELLEHQKEELIRSNQELEQFAYVASHDLQEPLRMVSSYMQLLERRYKGKLDQDADEFIGFAVDGASRMQRLISDLLSYSRVGTRGKPLEKVSSDEIVNQALENLSIAINDHNAVVTHDPLPSILADKPQLIQLFQNLIGNAIKFHGEKTPRVHISARLVNHEWVFSVKDNGIGFDPQYAERIFVIFQRLHERSEYAGTGIGLAICKKIVERHGGRIWVESQIGEGSTFYFSIPEKKDAI